MRHDDIERLNLLPINQLAAIKLRTAHVAADAGQLTVFQLMQWGLDAGVPLTHRRTARELERLCQAPDPGRALDYLLEKLPGGVTQLHQRLVRLRPRDAAQVLLEVLDMRLKADPRNPYPSEDPVT
jgi:hypothetical protein